jgi:hypothetical protein
LHRRFSTVPSLPHRLARATAGATLLLMLAACAAPMGPEIPPSPTAAAAPRPSLGETAPFRAALAEAPGDVERLAGSGAALAERAEGLQTRGVALQDPVIEPARRARLLGAAGAGS